MQSETGLSKTKILVLTLILALSISVGCLYSEQLKGIFEKISAIGQRPCEKEITYSIGTFDNEFGIDNEEFLNSVKKAAQIWNSALDKNIFVYHENGDLKINLIYDIRQDATVKLQKLGLTISQDQASYNTLKEKYASLLAYYNDLHASIISQTTSYNAQKTAYDAQVNYWQSKGGAPRNEFNRLEDQRKQLNAETVAINQATDKLNSTADSINAAATVLNQLAANLNINAKIYNGIGVAQGNEFQEGVYKRDGNFSEIDIYQFDNKTKLVRVLIHEMGHALGIKHVPDPASIMYEVNSGTNLTLTASDITALRTACNISK
jgi:predicted Zn-dependent protease